jgi:hypothetical protein
MVRPDQTAPELWFYEGDHVARCLAGQSLVANATARRPRRGTRMRSSRRPGRAPSRIWKALVRLRRPGDPSAERGPASRSPAAAIPAPAPSRPACELWSASEHCHTCASRAPITLPFPPRSAIVTRVPNCSCGSSKNRASATASPCSSTRPSAIVNAVGEPATRRGSVRSSRPWRPDSEGRPRCARRGSSSGSAPHPRHSVQRRRRAGGTPSSATWPEMFADRASWLTLLATAASNRRASNNSAINCRRSVGVSSSSSADSTNRRGTDPPELGRPRPEPVALCLGQCDLLVHRPRLGFLARRRRPCGASSLPFVSALALTAPPPGRPSPTCRSRAARKKPSRATRHRRGFPRRRLGGTGR